MNFAPYQLIDYSNDYQNEVLGFIDQGYKSVGYTSLELNTLDQDLTTITDSYSYPSCFKLLLNQNIIIGTVAIKIEDSTAELKRVFVDPKYRGQGLGKKLSLWAFDYAKEHDCNLIDIWSGTLCNVAHKLYADLGAIDQQEERCIGGQDDCYEYHFIKTL